MSKRVLVTGGSRGIGKSIVELYHEHGYVVEAPGRSELDLAAPASVETFLDRVRASGIGYDIVVNDAGVNLINEIDKVKDCDLEEMLSVNLLSPIRLLRGLVPHMKEKNFGRIVNIGSIWGVISKPGRSIYSATKHGLHGISTTLALELAPYGILVNTVAPGQTMTELTVRNNPGDAIKKMEEDIPVGRLAQPVEIAKAVFWLGSEENTYITGQQIVVDGGLTIK